MSPSRARTSTRRAPPPPSGGKGAPPPEGRPPPRGFVAFDLDGTLLDDMNDIGRTAARVLHEVFGTLPETAEQQYFQTTGKPFELQLRELYPEATPFELVDAARRFHEAKVRDAYAQAVFFPEVPRMLKALDRAGWALVVTTGAEKEMAEVLLERGGLGFLFAEVKGAAQGTKDEHLKEFQGRWPGRPGVLVGDAKFDIEAGRSVPGITVLGRACALRAWSITPADLRRWGAAWADYSLQSLPQVLDELLPVAGAASSPGPSPPARSGRARRAPRAQPARTYTGTKTCVASGCRRRATWTWKGATFCDKHLTEEAGSVRLRQQALREARQAMRGSPR